MKPMTPPPEKRYTESEIISKISSTVFAGLTRNMPASAIFRKLVARGQITGSDEEGWVISPFANLAIIVEEIRAENERKDTP